MNYFSSPENFYITSLLCYAVGGLGLVSFKFFAPNMGWPLSRIGLSEWTIVFGGLAQINAIFQSIVFLGFWSILFFIFSFVLCFVLTMIFKKYFPIIGYALIILGIVVSTVIVNLE